MIFNGTLNMGVNQFCSAYIRLKWMQEYSLFDHTETINNLTYISIANKVDHTFYTKLQYLSAHCCTCYKCPSCRWCSGVIALHHYWFSISCLEYRWRAKERESLESMSRETYKVQKGHRMVWWERYATRSPPSWKSYGRFWRIKHQFTQKCTLAKGNWTSTYCT